VGALAALARLAIAVVAAPLLVVAAAAARPGTLRRRRSGAKPRLVYGPVPVISIKFMSEAMAQRGYETRTIVYDVYAIHGREDFDEVLSRPGASFPVRAVRALLGPYAVFLRTLFRFDVFHVFFDGGFLLVTPLRLFEVQLLHLAGKKVVAMPYGSDVAAPSHMHSLTLRNALAANYPHLGRNEEDTLRRIRYFCERADFVLACIMHLETLPRWDLLTTHYYPIDTDDWKPAGPAEERDVVTVVHAPNHRALKGTEFLIAACDELKREGVPVELRLLEGMPNTEVKRAIAESDILAEQFIIGYALTAIEAMSLGKPVLSNLSDNYYYEAFRLYTGLDECPVVDTPVDRIKENLRLLVEDPDRRRELGEAGRRYVERFHSYDSAGRMWDAVYDRVWHGRPLELVAWNPGRDDG
jgi:glycosyltransferase involved in cell wall biosynthesis